MQTETDKVSLVKNKMTHGFLPWVSLSLGIRLLKLFLCITISADMFNDFLEMTGSLEMELCCTNGILT